MKSTSSLIFLFLALLPLLQAIASEDVSVAVIMKLNDDYAKFPQSILKGFKYALNNSKAPLKFKINEFSHDGSIESLIKAIENAKKTNPKIIFGGETSQFSMIIAKEFNDKIFITPTASSILINQENKNVLRLSHADTQYIDILKYVLSKNKFKNVGIIHNISYPNTDMLSKLAHELLVKNKINVHKVEVVKEETLNKEKLDVLIKNKVDCVVLFSYDDDLRKVFTVLSENNLFPLYVGADGWGRDDFLQRNLLSKPNGQKFKGIRSLYWNSSRKNAWFQKEKTSLALSLKENIDAFHAIGYDSGKVISSLYNPSLSNVDFFKQVKLKKVSNLMTTESLGFDENLYPQKDFYLFRIENSRIIFESAVNK